MKEKAVAVYKILEFLFLVGPSGEYPPAQLHLRHVGLIEHHHFCQSDFF